MTDALKALALYVWKERDATLFTLGLIMLFVGIIQTEYLSDYLRGLISVVIGLLLGFVGALLRRF